MVSHLLFVDDLLVMRHANSHMVDSLSRRMGTLASYLGLEHNLEKSFVCFSKKTHNIELYYRLLNIQPGNFPLKYLGIPLVQGSLKSYHFNCLFNKITRWLAEWKSKFLSFGGRLQLLRYTVNRYLFYWLYVIIISKAILNKLNSLHSNLCFHSVKP